MSTEQEVKVVSTTIHVSRTTKSSGRDEHQDGDPETIEVHKFATNPAIVSVSYPVKLTKAYQTVGITVGVSLPCYAEEVPQAFERANNLVIERMKIEMPKIKALLAKMAEERG
jgi:hypothetical protein